MKNLVSWNIHSISGKWGCLSPEHLPFSYKTRYWSISVFKLCSLKKKNIISRARFWSSDLWVMGPARFHCATLLLICKSSGKKSFNRHSRITFSFDSFTCAFCIKTFSLRDAHFTLNICVLRVSFICVYNPFQKKKKVESLPNYSVLLGMESLELLSVYVI